MLKSVPNIYYKSYEFYFIEPASENNWNPFFYELRSQ